MRSRNFFCVSPSCISLLGTTKKASFSILSSGYLLAAPPVCLGPGRAMPVLTSNMIVSVASILASSPRPARLRRATLGGYPPLMPHDLHLCNGYCTPDFVRVARLAVGLHASNTGLSQPVCWYSLD